MFAVRNGKQSVESMRGTYSNLPNLAVPYGEAKEHKACPPFLRASNRCHDGVLRPCRPLKRFKNHHVVRQCRAQGVLGVQQRW